MLPSPKPQNASLCRGVKLPISIPHNIGKVAKPAA